MTGQPRTTLPAVMPILVALALAAGTAHAQATPAAAPASQPSAWLASYDSIVVAIERTYFDTAFVRSHWRRAGDSLRPRASAVRSAADFRAVTRALLGTVPASHFYLVPAEAMQAVQGTDGPQGDAEVGMELRVAEGRLVAWRVDTLGSAWRAGVRAGDAVVRIDARELQRALAKVLALPDPRARRLALLNLTGAASGLLRGPEGSVVTLHVERPGTARPRSRIVSLLRTEPKEPLAQFGGLPPLRTHVAYDRREVPAPDGSGVRKIGVIGFNIWLPTVLPLVDDAVDRARGCHAMVLDLRGNPGGIAQMVNGIAGHLLDTAVSLGALHGRGSTLRFAVNPRRVTPDGRIVVPFAGPVALLVDEHSASTSEIFAGGLQALGRVRVFGERSAGQALLASTRPLPSGDVLVHAIADLTGPRGERFEGDGVLPDELVPVRRADLARGMDAPMNAALQWAASQPTRATSAGVARCDVAGAMTLDP